MFAKIFRNLPNSVSQNLTAAYFRVQTWRTVGFKGTHSIPQDIKFSEMDVKILPALQDNYMYLIIDNKTRDAAVVDPVDPDAVLAAVKKEKVNLKCVLTTHHHWDHAGGNENLVAKFPNELQIYGGDERIGALTDFITQDDIIQVGSLTIKCIFTPCHTTGHICYYIEAPNGRAIFTGDTLFGGGCGRFFEGTPQQMYTALIDKLSLLPNETSVFCGHEYTLQNLAYGKHVEPNNEDILKRINWATAKRAENVPTVPTTIGDEKKVNPFMRVNEPSVQAHAGKSDGISTMFAIRKEKDNFKA